MTLEKICGIAREMGWIVVKGKDDICFVKVYESLAFQIVVHIQEPKDFLAEFYKNQKDLNSSKLAYDRLTEDGYGPNGMNMGEVYEVARDFVRESWWLKNKYQEVEDRKLFVRSALERIKDTAREIFRDVQRENMSEKENRALDLLKNFLEVMEEK